MPSKNNPSIELQSVGKRFGLHWSLRNVDLKIHHGESIALFGPNGSGKSTLLKIISTLLSPSQGSLKIFGFDGMKEKREIREKIRLLSHEKQLYPLLTVMENLKIAADLRGAESPKIDLILKRLDMTSFQNKKISELSEGMKKRVMLARLLINSENAEIILLDEPQPTLDTEGRKVLSQLLQEWKTQGKTLIMSSHDHAEALVHVDRLIVLESGQITFDGKPDQ